MYKFIGLSRRNRTNLTHEEYSRYYHQHHGPLVMSVPEVFGHFRKYTQHHLSGEHVHPDWDAVGEIYFDSIGDVQTAFSAPRYLSVIRSDELYVADQSQGRLALVTKDTLVVEGDQPAGSYKLFRFLSRSAGIDHEQFRAAWLAAAAELTGMPEFQALCGRYIHSDLAFDDPDPMNTGKANAYPCDGCASMWFRSEADWRTLFGGRWGARLAELEAGFVNPDDTIQLFTDERIMYEPEGWRYTAETLD